MWNDGIDGVHKEIAGSTAERIRVLAGPGTGKTFGLQRRVVRLLEEGVEPRSILAVTFTRAAARSLRDDLAAIDAPGASQIQALTLHSLAFQLLRQARAIEKTGRHPRPVALFEREPIYSDLADHYANVNYSGKTRKRRAIEAFETAWATGHHSEPGWPPTRHEREFHTDLLDWLRFHRAMLIGEVVPMALFFLRSEPDAFRYAHTLTDEFQDWNTSEQMLVEELGRGGSHLVIGDDDQAIYQFKHAHVEGIIEYDQKYADTLALTIDECRRCPPLVVSLANELMSHQEGRLTDRAMTCFDPEKPEDVAIVRYRTVRQEARGTAHFIQQYLQRHRDIPPGRVIVLAPRRQLGYAVRDCLVELGVPSRSYFHEQEFDGDAPRLGYTALRLTVDPLDRVSLRWWLGRESPTWNRRAYRAVRDRAAQTGEELDLILDALADGSLRLPNTNPLGPPWAELKGLRERLRTMRDVDLIDELFPQDSEECVPIRAAALEAAADEDVTPEELLQRLDDLLQSPEVPQESDVVR